MPTQKKIAVHVTPVVWQVDGSFKCAVTLDFVNERGGKLFPMFCVKPEYFARFFEFVYATGCESEFEGKYCSAIMENMANIFSKRAHPGEDRDEPLKTDEQKLYDFRVLSGVFSFYPDEKDDEHVAKELDEFIDSLKEIISNENFVQDYTLGAWAWIARKNSTVEEIQNEIIAFDGNIERMYDEDDKAGRMFKHVRSLNKKEVDNLKDVPLVMTRNVALDEIFLDRDACNIGYELYGPFHNKHSGVLMKYPTKRNRQFIIANMATNY